MSSTDAPVVHGSAKSEARSSLVAGAVDALVVAVWSIAAGLLGALVWWQLTPLPTVVRSADGAVVAPEQLVKEVNIDGWFFVVAVVGGLLTGVILLAWRRRDPLLMVVLVVLGGALASWLMIQIGLALGPEKETTALRSLPEGAKVSMQLKLHATGIAWIWPIAAGLGAVIYLWILSKPRDEAPTPD